MEVELLIKINDYVNIMIEIYLFWPVISFIFCSIRAIFLSFIAMGFTGKISIAFCNIYHSFTSRRNLKRGAWPLINTRYSIPALL